MDHGDEIDALVAIAPRSAGSDSERRAARHLQKRLQERGRDAEIEPIRIRPSWGLTHLIHAVAGVVASVLAVYAPLPGLTLALITTVSAFGDLTGAFHLARLLTPVRASQNVVSETDTNKPGLLILTAHYDAPRAAILEGPRLRAWPRVFFGSLALITVCALGRVFGADATWFTIIQFIPTVVLIATGPLFADAAIADTVDGRANNASGAVLAVDLAGEELEHFDVMALLTGGSAHFALGMRAWLKRHRKGLDPEVTAVIVLDHIGGGEPRYSTKEGAVIASRMHPTLTELASEDATAFVSRECSDAYVSRATGLPTLRLASDGAAGDPEALARFRDYAAGLMRRIDEEVGARLV